MKEEIISFFSQDASHRLILLHGWGADANDLIPLGKELLKRIDHRIELIALNAPEMHPEGAGRQWYGLFPSDWSAVPDAIEKLKIRLKKIGNNQIPLEKSFLLGFSQGGAMALESGCGLPFAALIGCSAYSHPGWQPLSSSPPIFLVHGLKDNLIPLEVFENNIELLKKNKLEFDTYIFDGGHEIPPETINKISSFISRFIELN